MRNDLTRVLGACFFGATIGLLFSIQFQTLNLWLGAPLGGLLGYIAVDFRSFFLTARRLFVKHFMDFHLHSRDKHALASLVALLVVFSVSGVTLFVIAEACLMSLEERMYGLLLMSVSVTYIGAGVLIWSLCSCAVLIERSKKFEKGRREAEEVSTGLAIFANPIVLPLIALVVTGYLTYQFCRYFLPIWWRFLVDLFVGVHSDLRLLCGLDSFLGVVSGFLLFQNGVLGGNQLLISLLGGVIGAIFGGLNYQIVSIRWLKLVPQRNS